MEFIGNKNEIYDFVIESNNIALFPDLKLAEFQIYFNYLSNTPKEAMIHYLKLARSSVDSELHMEVRTLDQCSLYKNAVFALAACYLLDVQISTDATKEAADRQESLMSKRDLCAAQSRSSIDILINNKKSSSLYII